MSSKWLVVYTKPRHEKKSAVLLNQIKINVYLPLHKKLMQWSDRKKWVEKPLFPGYLFVNIEDKDYYNVLNCKGIVKYIFHSGKPAIVSNDIIEGIKESLIRNDIIVENKSNSSKNYNIGEDVNLIAGPFKNLSGKIIEIRGKNKIAIEIDCLNKIVLIEYCKEYLG